MSQRTCKYGCSTQLDKFDTKENKYLELDGKTLHTKERCQELKSKKEVDDWANKESKQETQDLSLGLVLKKLKSIGITIDLEVLRNAVNGDKH